MLSIDEAIAHEREIAEEQRKDNDNCKYKSQYGCKDCADYYSKTCIECAKEHEQLAEWLEELKKRRSEDYGYMADIHQSIGYRKAIDDFVKALRIEYSPVSDEMQNEYDNVCLRFEKIAEQLKAGDDNA